MQHSYDSLDRAGGFDRVNMLAPLRHRDFRRLWLGMTASLVGDGVFLVAMAWQVYEISNAPSALSMVGIAMTIPTLLLLLFGGVVTDRFERRRILIASDLVRGGAVSIVAALSITGTLEIWHMMVLVAVYGAGTAFFGPAFDAIVPDLLPAGELPQANSLDQFVRPIEISQSRLETRPSSAEGTSLCLIVAHTIVPAVSNALNRKLAIISCQTAAARP